MKFISNLLLNRIIKFRIWAMVGNLQALFQLPVSWDAYSNPCVKIFCTFLALYSDCNQAWHILWEGREVLSIKNSLDSFSFSSEPLSQWLLDFQRLCLGLRVNTGNKLFLKWYSSSWLVEFVVCCMSHFTVFLEAFAQVEEKWSKTLSSNSICVNECEYGSNVV